MKCSDDTDIENLLNNIVNKNDSKSREEDSQDELTDGEESIQKKTLSYDERIRLVELAEQYKHVVENKAKTPINARQKYEVWKKIEKKFAISGFDRDIDFLRVKYINLKNRLTTKIRKYTTHKNAVDGGPEFRRLLLLPYEKKLLYMIRPNFSGQIGDFVRRVRHFIKRLLRML